MIKGCEFTDEARKEFGIKGTAGYPIAVMDENGRIFIPTGEFMTDHESETTFIKVTEY
ncbi:hypothetical protein ACFXG4_23395 [Nocardia sp. NPDC059246]|uniref:hypothetical protein n=1 Tax=unclassified Nocardia TaxID=2637762 RepID=UPI0036B1050E